MAYRHGYSRNTAPRAGRWMELRYAGTCTAGETLPAGSRAFYDPADRSVTCTDLEHAAAAGLTTEVWQGSPVSGSWVRTLSDHRLGGPAADPFSRTRSRGYYGRDAGRCEDAPCCGCCS
jgi:hypothetical protein